MLADELDHVVGVDTHRDQPMLAVVVVPTGAVVAQRSVAATPRRYSAALRFADEFAPGRRLWAIEGAGHYGAGLGRHLTARNEMVHESARSTRAERRLRGKDDPLDAIRAARSVIGTGTRATPRSGERQEALRVLMVARRSAVDVRRVALVQLRSVIVTTPETPRQELRLLPVTELVRRCSRFRRSSTRTPDYLATVLALRSLAQRIQAATHEAALLEREILAHLRALAPELLDEAGVGPIVAAQLIVSWPHKDRVAPKQLSHDSPASRRYPPRADSRRTTASAAAATANPTVLSTPSSSTGANTTRPPRTTSPAASPKTRHDARRPGSSSPTSPATSTASCKTPNHSRLDSHRRFIREL